MKFIVDESTGTAAVEYLRQAGHDVVAVAEILPQANDADILALAQSTERILITNDKDFGELAYRDRHAHHGVLLLRLREDCAENRIRLLAIVLEGHSDRLADRFCVVTESNIRFRPITQSD